MTTWLGMYEQNIRQMYDDMEKKKRPEEYKQKEVIRAYLEHEKERKKKERWEKIKKFFKWGKE